MRFIRAILKAHICCFDELNIFQQDIYAAAASSQYKYLSPAYYPGQLKIGARAEALRNSAIRMRCILWREQQRNIAALVKALIIFADKINMQKTLIPENAR